MERHMIKPFHFQNFLDILGPLVDLFAFEIRRGSTHILEDTPELAKVAIIRWVTVERDNNNEHLLGFESVYEHFRKQLKTVLKAANSAIWQNRALGEQGRAILAFLKPIIFLNTDELIA